MAENHDSGNTPKQCDVVEEKCLTVDIPAEINPKDLSEDLDAYEKIPQDKRDGLNDKRDLAIRAAAQTLESSQLDNSDVLADACSQFDSAISKAKNSKTKLKTQISNDVRDLYAQYKKWLRDAMPSLKNCSQAEAPPDYIQAIYVTQFRQEIAKKRIDYQEKIKAIRTEELAANAAWEQAKQVFQDANCKAEATNDEAKLAAFLQWRKDLKEALETMCK
jgi:hypothetical protein